MKILTIEPTPSPNSMKIVIDRRTYHSAKVLIIQKKI